MSNHDIPESINESDSNLLNQIREELNLDNHISIESLILNKNGTIIAKTEKGELSCSLHGKPLLEKIILANSSSIGGVSFTTVWV